MSVKSRLIKLEKNLNINKKKECITLLWLADKPTEFKNKMYNNFEELKKEYPTIEDDFKLINFFIVYE